MRFMGRLELEFARGGTPLKTSRKTWAKGRAACQLTELTYQKDMSLAIAGGQLGFSRRSIQAELSLFISTARNCLYSCFANALDCQKKRCGLEHSAVEEITQRLCGQWGLMPPNGLFLSERGVVFGDDREAA